jgi:hypothetical protein
LLSLKQAQTRKITKHNTINKSRIHSIKTTKITKNNQQIKQNESPKIINKLINKDEMPVPGGSAQTRDYYSDSSSRRRKSLDRSNSIRKTAAVVVAEIDELKWGDTGRILCRTIARRPSKWGDAGRILCGKIARRPSKWGDAGRLLRDTVSMVGNGERKGLSKKSRQWSKAWNRGERGWVRGFSVRIGQLGREGRLIWKGREYRGDWERGWVRALRGLGIGRVLGEGGREKKIIF